MAKNHQKTNFRSKVAIIGGGASGLTAAITAAENNCDVCVFESNARVGKKLLSTGNGRCNISNKNIAAEQYNDEDFFAVFNQACPPKRVLRFLADSGIRLTSDSEGRIYPATYAASSVLDSLRYRCERGGVVFNTDSEIICIKMADGKFVLLEAGGERQVFDRVIIATGSAAGGGRVNAELIKSVEKLGHRHIPFIPLLAPLKTNTPLSALKNQRERASLTIGERVISGEIQFKTDALSGIAVFEASFFRNKYLRKGKNIDKITLDFVEDMSIDDLSAEIDRRLSMGYTAENLLSGLVSNRVSTYLGRKNPAEALKKTAFNITGSYDLRDAQVCDGGFDTLQIDRTMQSIYVRGLFFAGECLNFAGNCGGFNLHAALATGIIAGEGCSD